jgi:hypothetical protein
LETICIRLFLLEHGPSVSHTAVCRKAQRWLLGIVICRYFEGRNTLKCFNLFEIEFESARQLHTSEIFQAHAACNPHSEQAQINSLSLCCGVPVGSYILKEDAMRGILGIKYHY